MAKSDNGGAVDEAGREWTVDELAGLVGLPVRTIREYQTIGILPAPRLKGRVGVYGPSHLNRLELITRMRGRGYSLAGIGDLLGSWGAGADLGEVLGLEPDQLLHIDEPGAPATLDQLSSLFPGMVPEHLDDLESTRLIERSGPDTYCVPSPSLLQLAIHAQGAGLPAKDVISMFAAIRRATDEIAEEVVNQLGRLAPGASENNHLSALIKRGRGLLGHGVGRLTLHQVGQRLGVTRDEDVDRTLQQMFPVPAEVAV